MLETFRDLEEMRLALLAVREACDLPIVAQMTFEEDGRTQMGSTAQEVVSTLQELGADVIGANCSTGPQRMARVITEMVGNAGGKTPISAQPNAGWPEMVNNRVVYVSTPNYMANFARRMYRLRGQAPRRVLRNHARAHQGAGRCFERNHHAGAAN